MDMGQWLQLGMFVLALIGGAVTVYWSLHKKIVRAEERLWTAVGTLNEEVSALRAEAKVYAEMRGDWREYLLQLKKRNGV